MLILPKVYGIQMQEGVFLKYNGGTNSQNYIVLNEAAVKVLGWTSAVGKTIKLGAINSSPQTIVGVVKDYHFESLQKKIQPLIIGDVTGGAYRYYSLKLNTSSIGNTTINALQHGNVKGIIP